MPSKLFSVQWHNTTSNTITSQHYKVHATTITGDKLPTQTQQQQTPQRCALGHSSAPAMNAINNQNKANLNSGTFRIFERGAKSWGMGTEVPLWGPRVNP